MITAPAVPSPAEYQFISQLVYERSRINLGPDKRELVAARLGKRLRAWGLESFADYCDLLKSSTGTEEMDNLIDVISTNHTHFFREIRHFDFLVDTVLPDFDANRASRGRNKFRCWSAASSSGEEPYSIAITLAEHGLAVPGFDWELEASDICSTVLEAARRGIYPQQRLGDVKQDLLRRYFQLGTGSWEGHYRAKESLRSRMRWHRLNLFEDRYPFNESFDVIFCRNVMIYFDRPSQEQLIAKLSRFLVPGGYLMIGHSESLTGLQQPLQAVRPAIYRKAK